MPATWRSGCGSNWATVATPAGPIIKEAAIEQTRQPTIVRSTDPKTGMTGFYGMGWNVDFRDRGVEWSHAGAFSAGARTLVHMLPAEKLGIVILSNAFPTGVPEGLAATFLDEVYAGKPSRDWIAHWNGIYDESFGAGAQKQAMAPYASPPAMPSPSMPLQAYTGFYSNDYVGDIRVTESRRCLVGRAWARRQTFYPEALQTVISSSTRPLPRARAGWSASPS